MMRRQALRALWAGSIVAALPGCIVTDWTRRKTDHVAESKDKDKDKDKADEPIIKYTDDGDADSVKKGIFKGNYRRGAWSSDAAEIERDLGVGR